LELFPFAPGVYVFEVPVAKELIIGSGIPRSDNSSQERHHTNMVKLVVEIECFDMSFDEVDKETGSSDRLQPKQADLSCVHALNEPHLHEIHVFPSKHEVDLC
nr:hypothetical protein [Tanacetum cinerariifolium]